jgi:hypothetical protein
MPQKKHAKEADNKRHDRLLNLIVGQSYSLSYGRYIIILYHDLKDDFVHKLCSYICMLLYSKT